MQDFINSVRSHLTESNYSGDAIAATKEADSWSHDIYQGKSNDHSGAARTHHEAHRMHQAAAIHAMDKKKKEYHSVMAKQHKDMFIHHDSPV
jgi:hypothetical protein